MKFPREYSVGETINMIVGDEKLSLEGVIESYKADRSRYFIEFSKSPQFNGWYTRAEVREHNA